MDWPQDAAHTPVASGKTLPRGWRQDDRFVYIGLPGYGDGQPKGDPTFQSGAPFGKPWDCLREAEAIWGRVSAKSDDLWRHTYRDYLVARIETDPVFAGAVAALHGKTLVCWCKGKPKRSERDDQSKFCHGDMLAYAAERLYHSL